MNKPIHFLCCKLPNCYVKERYVEHNRLVGLTRGRLNHFSSLNELLRHQHLVHSDERFDKCSPDQLFHLPKEVVFALSGIIEVGQLDDDTATVDQLDNLGCRLQWSNSNAHKKTHTWRELVSGDLSYVVNIVELNLLILFLFSYLANRLMLFIRKLKRLRKMLYYLFRLLLSFLELVSLNFNFSSSFC